MATRSAIGYQEPDGSTTAVYCHWDGSPEHQLPILEKHYNSLEKVKALIAPGSMSSLRTRSTWDCGDAIKDANGYTRDLEGNLMYVNDREPQPLYHHERVGFGDDYAEKPINSHWPRNEWFHNHDCEHLYVWVGNGWAHYSEADS